MSSHSPPPLSSSSSQLPPYIFPKSAVQYPFHHFLNNPGSLFEHKFFTTLSLLMRNISEHIQDYTHQYYSLPTDQFYNASSVRLLDGDGHDETEQLSRIRSGVTSPGHVFTEAQNVALTQDQVQAAVIRGLLTFFCILTATYFINRTLLRRNRLIQYVIEVLLCHAIILPILPFVGLFFGTIGIARILIWVHIKLFHNGKRFLVSAEDGFWGYEEHASSSSSIGLYMIEGKCDMRRIRERVRVTVASPVVNGRMHRRLITVCGFPVWETVELDSDDHIKIAEWGEGDKRRQSTEPWTDKDVLDFLTTFQDIPLSSSIPAWEVIIVPDVRIGGGDAPHYACIFRVHHGIMDGISSANVLHQVLGDKPFKFTIDPVEGGGKRRGKIVTFLMYFLALLVLPRTGLINGLLNLDNKYNKFFSPGKTLRGPKHFAWSRPLRMDAFKKIKDSTKTSVMTVLLSSLGGSYRAMDEGRRWRVGKNAQKLPEFFHALAPVALLPYPDRHPRNGFSGVVLPVCVGEHKNAIERLRVNDREFKKLGIGIMDILGNFLLIGMVGVMPNCLQKVFGGSVHAKMSLSNIPGSDEEVHIFGHKIVEMGAWLPCKFSLGMAMGLFSYGGRCRATMVGDSTYLSKSDVESLVANFETEICELGKSLGIGENEIFY